MSKKRRPRWWSLVSLTAFTGLIFGCQKAPWVEPARHGSLKDLSQSVGLARRDHDFTKHELETLAHAVAEREISSASDRFASNEQAAPHLNELAACAGPLKSALTRRAERDDALAASGLISLIESGSLLSLSEWTKLQQSPHGWSRAAAARASTAKEQFAYRERALGDHDPRVRQNALRACMVAPAEEHRETLVALLRASPDSESRILAARALGVLGGDDAYRVLTDAYAQADVPLRLALISAYAQSATFFAGGEAELAALARSEAGIVGVAAAASLAKGHSNLSSVGVARISRALEFGSVEEQRLAIDAASFGFPEQKKQLLYLGLHGEPLVQVEALRRWLQHAEYRATGTMLLRTISEKHTTEAILAREILAAERDQTVANDLRVQQGYAHADVRLIAARALYILEDYSSVARAIADDSPRVRLLTACMVLAKSPSP